MPTDAPPRSRRRRRQQFDPELPDTPLGLSLQANLQAVRTIMGQSDDLIVREFRMGGQESLRAAIICVGGLVEAVAVDDFVLRSVTANRAQLPDRDSAGAIKHIKEVALHIADVEEASTLREVLSGLLDGRTALLVEGSPTAITAGTAGWKSREPSEAEVESVVRGSKEAFTEDLSTNISAVRRRIRHPCLQVQKLKLGKVTQTGVAILYLEGIAQDKIVREVRQRISRIEIDGILEGGYIEELATDAVWSLLPLMANTERPDRVAASLLEGQVAIMVDGSPSVLLAPYTLVQFLQSPDDYYELWPVTLLVRTLRFLGLIVALYLPAVYVAVITYHHEMIPLGLALSIASEREGAPFPAVFENLLMEATFELLREAGMRLPRAVGPAISIVGGLVIGDAAIRAGIVGAPMVIVVAFTGLASFAIPAFNLALSLRLMRFPIVFIGATAGLPGVTLTALLLLCHLASLRSFGVPYLSPVAPGKVSSWRDVFTRAHWSTMMRRPEETAADRQRQKRRDHFPTR